MNGPYTHYEPCGNCQLLIARCPLGGHYHVGSGKHACGDGTGGTVAAPARMAVAR
jgi:hypothetical protein